MALFLVEFYTRGPDGTDGHGIDMAWIFARHSSDVLPTLVPAVGPKLGFVITTSEIAGGVHALPAAPRPLVLEAADYRLPWGAVRT